MYKGVFILKHKYDDSSIQVCTRCIMDTTVEGIKFDDDGVCNFCKIHDELERKHPLNAEGKKKLDLIVNNIKKDGSDKEYDCIVGVSGGRDSTYTLYSAVEMGLKPLAVHFDNGWNSEMAVRNIKNSTEALGVDLITVVADWEEFKDLQISFLKASVSDAEVPTDYAILSVLYGVANSYGIKYIFNGHSFRTEGVAPITWTYMDGKYIKGVHRKFGSKKIKSFPLMGLSNLLYYTFIKKIQVINLPEFIEYNHEEVDATLKNKLGWTYYGGHHHESLYTVFFQSYYLPTKFNIDKRKLEYSALIRSGQMTRNEAIKLTEQPYPYKNESIKYTLSKLGISDSEFDIIMNEKPKMFYDYSSYFSIIKACKFPIKVACNFGLLPHIFYEKYLG
jgi:N-acetyl sugar amidotransferase